MLALFTPWRSGYDLKPKDKSWDDVFVSSRFKPGHKLIMQNMNVKYECLDAHDDFFLQCCNNAQQQGFFSMSNLHITEQMMDEIDKDNTFEVNMDFEPMITNCIGRKTAKWEYDKGVIEEIMTNSDWLNNLFDNSTYFTVSTMVQPTFNLDASKWRAKVNEKKAEINALSKQSLSNNTIHTCSTNEEILKQSCANSSEPIVKIVNQSYLYILYCTVKKCLCKRYCYYTRI